MTHYTSIGNFRSTWVHIVLAAVAGRCCTSIRKPSSVNRGICVAGFSINDHRCPWISFSSHSTISRLGIIADVSNYFDLNAYHAITLLDPCEDSGSVSGPFPSRNIGNVVLCRPRNAHASDAAAASAPLKCTGLSLQSRPVSVLRSPRRCRGGEAQPCIGSNLGNGPFVLVN